MIAAPATASRSHAHLLRSPAHPSIPHDMPSSSFSYTADSLREIASSVLDYAQARGATAAETEVSEGFGQTVTVRRGEVETIEYNRDKGMGVTVYVGQQRGHASSSDFSPQAVRDTVDAALSIARFTAPRRMRGARRLRAARARDSRSRSVASVGPAGGARDRARHESRRTQASRSTRASAIRKARPSRHRSRNSSTAIRWDFSRGYPNSRHGIWCSLIAGQGDAMQRDDWYETRARSAELPAPAIVGRRAGERAVNRVGARKIDDDAGAGAVRGAGRVEPARDISFPRSAAAAFTASRRSCWTASASAVFSPLVADQRICRTSQRRSRAARSTRKASRRSARDIVRDGVVQGYFLGSYSARKLGMRSTGNAGGNHNLILQDTGAGFRRAPEEAGRGPARDRADGAGRER